MNIIVKWKYISLICYNSKTQSSRK